MGRTPEISGFALSRPDYSLQRKAPIDVERHKNKLHDAIRKNIGDIVTQPDVLVPQGDQIVRIPMPQQLDEYRFRYDPNDAGRQVGQGDGKSKVGDKIGGKIPRSGSVTGAGNEHAVHQLETWIPAKELEDLMFDGWRLPFLNQDKGRRITSPSIRFSDIRRSGAFANLDKRRTIKENIKRNAWAGNPHFGGIKNEDLRFRTWEEVEDTQSQAVLIFMRDVSGSMGENEQQTSRVHFALTKRFLERNYNGVETIFVTHDSEAQEVDEDTFFQQTKNGGTVISSAFELADSIIDQRFSPSDWNIYPMYITDGDNYRADYEKSARIAERLLWKANAFNFVQVNANPKGKILDYMSQIFNDNPQFIGSAISNPRDAYGAAQHFFTARD